MTFPVPLVRNRTWHYTYLMASTHDKVSAKGVETALRMLEGRWKLLILVQLFGGQTLRFSDLERAIPAVSQKMLIQQLRNLERDGLVRRRAHPEVPPRVDYALTEWGQALCPALDALLTWAENRPPADI